MNDTTTNHRAPDDPASYWRRLLHRWLIEYNPLYLLSATLVLGGMILTSRGLAREGSLYGEIGVAAIAEVYAATLIGGAALLTRIGHRRPAVMLALLTVLYQCDLTLHTETCAYLGAVGDWATAGWLALFVAKLYALAWAMKLRLARSAIATATIGAFGLAILPHYLDRLDARGAGALVAVWLFAMVSIYRPGSVTSAVDLDAWGTTVFKRSLRAAWLMSAVLFVLHVLFWSTQHPLSLAALLPIAPLLAVRRLRSEARVWATVIATLVIVAVVMPGSFSVTAMMAAVALALRALPSMRAPSPGTAIAPRDTVQPYRAFVPNLPPLDPVVPPVVLVPVDRAERMRLVAGALFAAHLAVWTLGWSGGPWPAHVAALDLALTAVVLLFVWRARVRIALAPLFGCYAHFVVQAHLVAAPRSLLEWGGTAVGLGFALLIASLAATYRLRRTL
jgi:hypothetical protein